MHRPLVCLSYLAISTAALLIPTSSARAQFEERKAAAETKGAKLDKKFTAYYKFGLKVVASKGPCSGIYGTVPVAMEWPEQKVHLVEEKMTSNVNRVSYRELGKGVRQMVVDIPYIREGEEASATVTYEIQRNWQVAPDDTSGYVIPTKLDRDLKIYLAPSPFIESKNPKIVKLAKEAALDKENWAKIEAIYDLARSKVKYKNGPIKGALAALNDGTGDCEELSSLIIAMCRAVNVPARMVWVPGHCYPEFYMTDASGKGCWFPCQAAGARAFGGIPEQRPILQKGDNFRDPDRPKDHLRYVSEFLKGGSKKVNGQKGSGKPKVTFILEQVAPPK